MSFLDQIPIARPDNLLSVAMKEDEWKDLKWLFRYVLKSDFETYQKKLKILRDNKAIVEDI